MRVGANLCVRPMARRRESTKARKHEGAKARRHEGAKARRRESAKARKREGTKECRNTINRVSEWLKAINNLA